MIAISRLMLTIGQVVGGDELGVEVHMVALRLYPDRVSRVPSPSVDLEHWLAEARSWLQGDGKAPSNPLPESMDTVTT